MKKTVKLLVLLTIPLMLPCMVSCLPLQLGIAATDAIIKGTSGSKNSQGQEEYYDAARHRYYTIDKDGNRQYK